MIADAEPRMAGIRDAGHSPAENQCGKSSERRPTAERDRKPVSKQQRADSQHDQRDVENDDEYDRGPDVAQQFARLGRVRGGQVQEHVHGYHRLAEKIQQDQLASVQYDFRQQTPDHHSGFTRQQQNSHPERQRHDDRSKAHRNR